VSKKLFDIDSNVFRRFKDHFFKVLTTDIVANGLSLMFNQDREPRFPFFWQFDHTRLTSFDEDLLTLVERVNKAILEQLSALLDARTIFSLPSMDDPFVALDGNTCCVVAACFTGIMDDFAWRPLVKQVGLAGGAVHRMLPSLLLEKGVNLLLVLLRSPPALLPLFWLRGAR